MVSIDYIYVSCHWFSFKLQSCKQKLNILTHKSIAKLDLWKSVIYILCTSLKLTTSKQISKIYFLANTFIFHVSSLRMLL